MAVLCALLAELPAFGPGARTGLMLAAAAAALLVVAAGREGDDAARMWLRGGPQPLLALLLAGCVASAWLVAPRELRGYATTELLRALLCAGVYLAAAFALRTSDLPALAWGVLALGTGVCAIDLIGWGARTNALHSVGNSSVFGNHESIGSFLLLLLPVALSFALNRDVDDKARLGGQVVSLVVGAGLLLARTRAAWIGAAAALVTLSVLYAVARPALLRRSQARGRVDRFSYLFPLALVALGFGTLIVMGNVLPLVSQRAATFARIRDDSSLADRLHRWRSAARMTAERPVTGWGLGTWPPLQGRWTHQGDDTGEVLQNGTGHQNLAHNFWVQWASETGATGLALHVAFVVAVVVAGAGALKRSGGGAISTANAALAAGCLASVVGGAVDALGSPAYNFPGVSALWWLWMGVGLAALRPLARGREGGDGLAPAAQPLRRVAWAGAAEAGLLAAALVLAAGHLSAAGATGTPRGTLRVSAQLLGPAPGGGDTGTVVLWTASFIGAAGKERPTMPGTVWHVSGGNNNSGGNAAAAVVRVFQADGPDRSGWRGVVAAQQTMTATANYQDELGRRYVASATVTAP